MTHLATPDSPGGLGGGDRGARRRRAVGVDGHETGRLPTEGYRRDLADLDLRPTRELVRVINAEDATVAGAVAAAEDALADAIDAIVERLAARRPADLRRRRLVGPARRDRRGRVRRRPSAAADGQVVALVAGGITSLATAQEAAEDDAEAGARELAAVGVGAGRRRRRSSAPAAGRRTSSARRGRRRARRRAHRRRRVRPRVRARPAIADHEVAVVVGPEVITGSTRMKAGTAQKLVLNTISTVAFTRLGKTFGNLMVDVVATNAKLRARARRAVALATGASAEDADAALEAAGGEVKVAIVALLAGLDPDAARARLADAGGVVRRALWEPGSDPCHVRCGRARTAPSRAVRRRRQRGV